ncbi:MAG: hypothetical protein ABIJ96_07625 [Elusimicrobiota bacterium]
MSFAKRFTRFVALTVAITLVYASPGLGVYEVLAGGIASQAAAVKMTGPNVAPVAIPNAAGIGAANTNFTNSINLQLGAVLPGFASAPGAVSQDMVRDVGIADGGVKTLTSIAVRPVAPAASLHNNFNENRPWMNGAKNKPPRKQASIGKTSADVYAAIKDFGSVGKANAEAAGSFGAKLHRILTGGQVESRGGVVQPEGLQGLRHFGDGYQSETGPGFFAKPAGGESIGDAVQSYNGAHAAPHKGAIEDGVEGGDFTAASSGDGRRAPLPARIFAAAVASLPGALLGLPLLMGGMTVAGSLVVAASLGLVSMPFFGERTGKLIRIVPGVLIGALGLWTLGAGIMSGSGVVMGALVALGGWGLIRFGQSKNEEYFDEGKVLTAFFGALAAVAGAGLAVTTPAALLGFWAGWLPFISATSTWAAYAVTGVTWLSYPLAGMLLMHLPGWVGEGIQAGVGGVYQSVRGMYRVLGSMKRDTVLRDRLEQWSEAKLKLSHWNVFKVGAVWVPVLISEAAMAALSFVTGVAQGVIMAPTMFLWGAASDLAEKSRVNKFLAAWNRFVFFNAQGSKKALYNKLAGRLIPYANSNKTAVALIGGTALRAVQLGWWAYTVAATPFLYVIGFFRAFTQTGGEYSSDIHYPGSLKGRQQGDSPFVKPELGKKPVSDLIPPGLFATGLALLPLYFFGMPMLGVPYLGYVYAAAVLGLAAAPILPGRTPKLVRQLPGFLMTAVGLGAVGAALWLGFGFGALLAVAKTNMFWMGLVAAFSGLGFINNITKLAREDNKRWYSVDDPEYIGAFFGALGVLTGIGLAFAGVSGWITGTLMGAAYLSSGLLLMHLPMWLWTGVGVAFEGLWYSIKSFHRVINFWDRDTKFLDNMKKQARYHLDGSLWSVVANATWLSLIWVPTGLVILAEYAAALALGVVMGVIRAPVNWAWGAAYDISPDAKLTRFIAGFAKSLALNSEGSKKTVFDKWVGRLIPAMNEKVSPSGRPSVKAALAMIGARFLQVLWLARLLLWSPVIFIKALIDGFKNAAGVKDKNPEEGGGYGDPDDPDRIY